MCLYGELPAQVSPLVRSEPVLCGVASAQPSRRERECPEPARHFSASFGCYIPAVGGVDRDDRRTGHWPQARVTSIPERHPRLDPFVVTSGQVRRSPEAG